MRASIYFASLILLTSCQGSKVSSRAVKTSKATNTSSSTSTKTATSSATETIAIPEFSPAPDTYASSQLVSILSSTVDAAIYYTTDGSEPSTASTLYSGPVAVSASQTIKAMAAKSGKDKSGIASGAYIILGTVAPPSFSLTAGTYTSAQSITLTTITTGANIYYTVDGTTPTSSSSLYTGAITVAASQTIKAFAVKAASTDSTIAVAAYVITGTVATPSFSIAAGTYNSSQTVTITSATAGATLYYTVDGTTPSTASTLYSGAVTVAASQTLKAFAVKATWADSAEASAAYIILGTIASPTFSPAAGTYTSAQSVTLSTITAGATIYYTTDGTTPTIASTLYSGAITVSASQTVKAFAVKAASTDSTVASAAYVITGTVATPSFSIAAGTYTSSQSVTITSATSGATIYYTTDGSTPTTASTLYSSAVTVSASQTLKALAMKATWLDSAIGSAAYVITGTVATPSFSIAAGTYTSSQAVAITSATAGATIYYTTDGSTPTTASALYSSAVAVSVSQTLKALAVKATWTDSTIGSAAYVITGTVATPSFSVAPGTYGATQTVSISTATAGATIYYTTNGTTPTTSSSVYGSAISVSASQTLKAFAVKATWDDSAVASAAYVIDTTPPTITYTSIAPVSPHWNTSPTVTLNMSEAATVTLYSNAGCSAAISSATSLAAGAGQTVAPTGLTAMSTTAIYAKAVDPVGNVSMCTTLVSYTTLLKFEDPDPSAGNDFGGQVVPLPNGNVVITSQLADMGGATDSGAVYLFNGTTGALISTLYGTNDSDYIGDNGVTVLTNGNFVVSSWSWNNAAGAATWGSATTGVNGPISASNSLIGSTGGDNVSQVTALTNGNYVVRGFGWTCTIAAGCASQIGAVGSVTLGSGTTGTVGTVSTTNSLVGSTANDTIGTTITPLSNDNYVIGSQFWSCNVAAGCAGSVFGAGAATWSSGTTGVVGFVTTINSLVGSSFGDYVGLNIQALSNGNYVVSSYLWDCKIAAGCAGTVSNAGAVTWGSGTVGVSGAVSTSNSLVGRTFSDMVGQYGIVALTNGNYVIPSAAWDCTAAAGCSGTITNVGAVTWASGTTGRAGQITTANSLVGRTSSDFIGNVTALSNGNYVVASPYWDCTAAAGCSGTIADVGAVTWASGTTGLSGQITTSNSFVGSTANDMISAGLVTALTNGNYVISSPKWDCTVTAGCSGAIADVGAVTWASGTGARTGTTSTSNSLVGSTTLDYVGSPDGNYPGVAALTNGNYVVTSASWDCAIAAGCAAAAANVGATTWGSGTAGVSGPVSVSNSLVGSTASDGIGLSNNAVVPLNNGNYVLLSPNWNCPAAICGTSASAVGAVTWGSGTTGITGVISGANSLISRTDGDGVGLRALELANSNFVIYSYNPYFDCTLAAGCASALVDSNALIWGSGTTGVSGFISTSNAILGSAASTTLNVLAVNNNYIIYGSTWNAGAGLVVLVPGNNATFGQPDL